MKISVRGIRYTYPGGVEALRGVSLEIEPGERLGIVGQNGSGKTTLARHLNGLIRPAQGDVRIGDWDTRDHTTAELSRRVGFLFQNPDAQIFSGRVTDEVSYGPRNFRLPPAEIARRVHQALARTGLQGERETRPYDLLPSQRRWVALASVLALETPILVLDEPTTGQDAHGLARLGALVHQLAEEGRTVVVISHDVDFVAEHLERLVVMHQGEVLLDGPMREGMAHPEILGRSQVEPPELTRLGTALGWSRTVLNVDEFLDTLGKNRAVR